MLGAGVQVRVLLRFLSRQTSSNIRFRDEDMDR